MFGHRNPFHFLNINLVFHSGAVIKNLPANAGDAGDSDSILGLRRSPGVRNGNPLW